MSFAFLFVDSKFIKYEKNQRKENNAAYFPYKQATFQGQIRTYRGKW